MSSFDDKVNQVKEKESKFNLEKLGQAKEDIGNTIRKNKEHIGDFLYFSIYSLIIVAMLGIFELLKPTYDKTMFASIIFWTDYAILQTAIWTSRIMIKKLSDRKEFRNNLTYKTYLENIKAKVEKDEEIPYIDEQAQEEDRLRKTITFRNQQKLKIINLGIKYRITNIFQALKGIETTKIDDLSVFKLESDIVIKDKKQMAINSKLNEYLKTLTDEWIEENLDTQKVRYNKISRVILTNGIVGENNNSIGEDFKDHSTKEFLRLTIPTAIFTMAFTFLILPLNGEWSKDAYSWFKLITKLSMVMFTAIMMWVDNPNLFEKTKIKAISERSNKLNQFYNKKFDKGIK